MRDELINISGSTNISVPAKQIIRYVVSQVESESSLRLKVAPGAGVQLIVPVIPPQSNWQVEVGDGAQFTFSMLGKLTSEHHTEIEIHLEGKQAKTNIELAVISDTLSKAFFKVSLRHTASGTTGRINSRRIQRDRSIGKLSGLMYVGQAAHGTDTYLSDKALLLGALSEAQSDPQLEILADDVRASHGATIGRLSEEEIFYLRSRGLDEPEAQGLLLQAFLKPALIGVPLDLSQQFIHELSTW